MKKTDAQKNIIRRAGLRPIFWKVICDVGRFMIVCNRFTGTIRNLEK